jgi:hypothetical protein
LNPAWTFRIGSTHAGGSAPVARAARAIHKTTAKQLAIVFMERQYIINRG